LRCATVESRPQGKRGWHVRVFASNDFATVLTTYALCDEKGSYVSAEKTDIVDPPRAAARGAFLSPSARAVCPAGSKTSGGGYAIPDQQYLAGMIESAPVGPRAWRASVNREGSAAIVTSYAVCRKSG